MYFFEKNTKEEGLESIKRIARENFNNLKKIIDIQFITHMNKGIFGAQNLNKILQKIFSEGNLENKKIIKNWFIGDKVIQLKNNYILEVFNGEIGIIINGDFSFCEVEYEEKKIIYFEKNIHELALAYAITTHKSQGSEFKKVCIPLYMEHYINFNKKSLYTSITRAKEKCIILGEFKAIICAMRKENLQRKTYLSLNL